MNENEVTLTFVAEKYYTFNRRCFGCVGDNIDEICNNLNCKSSTRSDGRNVIFKVKETK